MKPLLRINRSFIFSCACLLTVGSALAIRPAIAPGDIVAVGVPEGEVPTVHVLNIATGEEICAFEAYPTAFRGGVRVAVGDVNGNGDVDIITAPGNGESMGHVKVFSGFSGTLLTFSGTGVLSGSAMDFAPFDNFSGAVNVATADFNGDNAGDIVVATGKGTAGHVKVFDGTTGEVLTDFFPFDSAFTGGVSVAVGDVNGDGVADVIAGEGKTSRSSRSARVKVFNGVGFSELTNIENMGRKFRGGVRVAAGDVNSDGDAEIMVGGAGQVKVFSGTGGAALREFSPYSPAFSGGVYVAAGDVNGDGKAEIVTSTEKKQSLRIFNGETGARLKAASGNPFFRAGDSMAGGDFTGDNLEDLLAGDYEAGKVFALFSQDGDVEAFKPFGGRYDKPLNVALVDIDGDNDLDIVVATGPGAGPHVKVFDGGSAAPLVGPGMDFVPFNPAFKGGVNVAVGDVNGDGFDDTILGQARGGSPQVVVRSGSNGDVLKDFLAYDAGFTGGVFVASAQVDTDGFADIITCNGQSGQGHVKVFSGATGAEIRSFIAFPDGTTSGASVCVGDVNDDGEADIVVGGDPVSGPQVKVFAGPNFQVAGGLYTAPRSKSQNNLKQLGLAVVEFDLDGELDLIVAPVKSSGKTKDYVFTPGGMRFAALESFFSFDPNYRLPQYISLGK